MEKDVDAFRTISEAAEQLDVPQHVLRFWELRFQQIKPMKRSGGRRYYRPEDLELLRGIKRLLYGEGYTIKGVQRILKEQGVRAVASAGQNAQDAAAPQPRAAAKRSAAHSPPPEAKPGASDEFPERRANPTADSPPSLSPAQEQMLRQALVELEECGRLLASVRES